MTEGPDVPWEELGHRHIWRTYRTVRREGRIVRYQRCMVCGCVRSQTVDYREAGA